MAKKIEIRYEVGFKKQYKKAPVKIQDKFEKRLRLFRKEEDHPLLRNHGLVGKWRAYRSINITGDWRAVYIGEKDRIVFVALGTHSQLYG